MVALLAWTGWVVGAALLLKEVGELWYGDPGAFDRKTLCGILLCALPSAARQMGGAVPKQRR